jgi:hypothetical protein
MHVTKLRRTGKQGLKQKVSLLLPWSRKMP